jgi:hypothetical protein
MLAITGTPVSINGRTGAPTGQPGPAPSATSLRVAIPVPLGRQLGGTPGVPANTGEPGVNSPATTFARYLRINNVDPTNNLLVGFLDGTQSTIVNGTSAEFSGTIPFFTVQASAATVQWDAFAIVAA